MKLHVTPPATVLGFCFGLLGLVGLASGAVAAPAPAAAAPAPAPAAPSAMTATQEDTLIQMIDLNKKAVAAYRAGQAQAAMTDLLAAAKMGNEQGLGAHDMMARTEVHIGIVAIAGLKDRQRGLQHFARALAIRPHIKLTPSLATPALKRDLRVARRIKLPPPAVATPAAGAPAAPPAADASKAKEASAVAKVDAPAEAKPAANPEGKLAKGNPNEPPLPKTVPQPLYCPTPDLGPTDQPVPLFCLTQPEVTAGKIVAYFRPAGGENYTTLTMNRSKSGWLTATVPAKDVKGHSLQVYFEAQDASGNVAANNGKDELPNVIQLKPGAPRIRPRSLALIEVGSPARDQESSSANEATPLELREIAQEKADAAGLTPKGRPRRAQGSIWVGFGVGSGYGWHLDLPLERHAGRQVTSGFSPAGLGHISPELGYQWTSRLSLSIQTRHQYLPAAGSGDAEVTGAPPQLAHAVLARLQYALFDLGDLQFVGSLVAGGGSALRMNIAPNKKSGLAASDTVVSGPGAAGAGLGLAYNFNPHLIATLEGRGLAGFAAFGVLIEGTAGLQLAF
jgi:hypothetical protein